VPATGCSTPVGISGVHRRELLRVEEDLVTENVALAGEVEVGVLRQVHHGRLVGGRGVIEAQGVVVGHGVNRLHRELAGVTFLAIGASVGQLQRRAELALVAGRLPDALVEAFQPAVQGVGIVVGGEGVFLTLQGELALGDAVAVTAYQAAEVRRLSFR
jgi:hypothetical protein